MENLEDFYNEVFKNAHEKGDCGYINLVIYTNHELSSTDFYHQINAGFDYVVLHNSDDLIMSVSFESEVVEDKYFEIVTLSDVNDFEEFAKKAIEWSKGILQNEEKIEGEIIKHDVEYFDNLDFI